MAYLITLAMGRPHSIHLNIIDILLIHSFPPLSKEWYDIVQPVVIQIIPHLSLVGQEILVMAQEFLFTANNSSI